MIGSLRRPPGRPQHAGWPVRADRRPQRGLASLALPAALAAGVALGQVVAPLADTSPSGVTAAWTSSTRAQAQVSQAKVSNAFTMVSGGGAITGGTAYSVSSSVVTSAVGYVDLVNTSAVPAILSLTVSTGSLVGSTSAAVCPVAWNTTNGSCAGGATSLNFALLLGVNEASYTSPTAMAVGARLRLRIAVSGNAAATATSVVPKARAGVDRTRA